MTKRLLICYAHPDDESFGLGAYISKCTAQGIEVSLICSTNGDVGTVEPEKMAGYQTVSELRLAELNCASQVLGLKHVITYGYRDSGMMGSEDNQHPQSLWQAPLDVVAGRIVDAIRDLRPQVVITFDRYGGYGHPDHIKMNQATLRAFELLEGDPVRPAKLYYNTFPRLMLRVGVTLMRLRGQDPRHAGRNRDFDMQAILDHVEPITSRVYVGDFYEQGQKAAACHDSQISTGGGLNVASWIERQIRAYHEFSRVYPPVQADVPVEIDLFAGVDDD